MGPLIDIGFVKNRWPKLSFTGMQAIKPTKDSTFIAFFFRIALGTLKPIELRSHHIAIYQYGFHYNQLNTQTSPYSNLIPRRPSRHYN